MAGAAQKSCWFKSLALSSLGVVLAEGDLVDTGTQTVILKMIQANQDYCLAYSPEEEEDSDGQAGRQGWSIFEVFEKGKFVNHRGWCRGQRP